MAKALQSAHPCVLGGGRGCLILFTSKQTLGCSWPQARQMAGMLAAGERMLATPRHTCALAPSA